MRDLGKRSTGRRMSRLVSRAVALVACALIVGLLVSEGRSGAIFERRLNAYGLWVSNVDRVVVGAVAIVAVVVGALWSRWDRRREQRLAERGRRKGPRGGDT